MRILLLSDPASSHTYKWATAIREQSVEVYVFGLHQCDVSKYSDKDIKVKLFGLQEEMKFQKGNSLSKLSYLRAVREIKSFILEIKPDIVHAHYVTSYGLLGALTKFHPFIISIWGSDIEEINFPYPLRKALIKYSFNHSDLVLATSNYLKHKGELFTKKEIMVTPFGVDTDKFSPDSTRQYFSSEDITLGTVKILQKTYGIDQLIISFAELKKRTKNSHLKLLIVGSGPEEIYLKELASKILKSGDYIFTGNISHDKINQIHNNMDIEVYLSKREGFGVSILESMACAKPVLVSDSGALPEIIENNISGIILSDTKIDSIVKEMEMLVNDEERRLFLGKNARERVLNKYSWNESIRTMMNIYNKFIK